MSIIFDIDDGDECQFKSMYLETGKKPPGCYAESCTGITNICGIYFPTHNPDVFKRQAERPRDLEPQETP